MIISRLKTLRVARGMTQFELGRKAGVSDRMISYWETQRGKPSIDQMIAISRVLSVDPHEIWSEAFCTVKK